jgi:hypothetical protein
MLQTTTTTMSHEQMVLAMQALAEENARLKANTKTPGLGIKVSTKGAVSVYGLGRFPITLYSSQWEALIGRAADIQKFIADNKAVLKSKGE